MKEDERNIIWTSKLKIDGNVLRYENSIVQIKNISRCEVEKMPEDSYPIWAILGSQLCIILLLVKLIKPNFLSDNASIFALIGFGVCTICLLFIFAKNENRSTYLIFELNSGGILHFACDDVKFLKNVHKAIIDCFNYNDVSYIINFNDCTIKDTQIGEHNEVSYQ